jgi:hypothetical protein
MQVDYEKARRQDPNPEAPSEAYSIVVALQERGWSRSPDGTSMLYANVRNTTLRLEYHPEQRSIHLNVSDDVAEVKLVLFYKNRLGETLDAIRKVQECLKVEGIAKRLGPLLAVCPQTWWVGPNESLARLT